MIDFSGKRGLVLGVGNQRSIAWAVVERLHQQGAELGLTFLRDPKGRFEANVRKLGDQTNATLIAECDVASDESIEALSALLQRAIPQATTRTLASIYRAARPASRRTNYASARQTNRTARELARCDSLQRRASCLDTRLHQEANRLLDEAMAPRRALCRAMRERMRGRRPPECAWARE